MKIAAPCHVDIDPAKSKNFANGVSAERWFGRDCRRSRWRARLLGTSRLDERLIGICFSSCMKKRAVVRFRGRYCGSLRVFHAHNNGKVLRRLDSARLHAHAEVICSYGKIGSKRSRYVT